MTDIEKIVLFTMAVANLATTLWTLLRSCQTWNAMQHLRGQKELKGRHAS